MRGLPRIQHFEDGGSDNSSPSSDGSYSGWSDSASFSDFGASWGDTTTSGNWSDSASWSDPGTSWSDAGTSFAGDTSGNWAGDNAGVSYGQAGVGDQGFGTGTFATDTIGGNFSGDFGGGGGWGTPSFSDYGGAGGGYYGGNDFGGGGLYGDFGGGGYYGGGYDNYSPSFDTYSGAPYADMGMQGGPYVSDMWGNAPYNTLPNDELSRSAQETLLHDFSQYPGAWGPVQGPQQQSWYDRAGELLSPYVAEPIAKGFDFLTGLPNLTSYLPSLSNPFAPYATTPNEPGFYQGLEASQQGREGWNALGPGMTSFQGSPMGAQQVDEAGYQNAFGTQSPQSVDEAGFQTPAVAAQQGFDEAGFQSTYGTQSPQSFDEAGFQAQGYDTANNLGPSNFVSAVNSDELGPPTPSAPMNVEVLSPSQVPASVMSANPAANLNQIAQEQQQSPALNLEPVNVEATRDAQQVPQAPSNAQEVQAEATTAAAQAASRAAEVTGAPPQSANAAAQAAADAVSRGADHPTTQQTAASAAFEAGANPQQANVVGTAAADAAVQARDAVVQTASAFPTTTEPAPDVQYHVPGGIPSLPSLSDPGANQRSMEQLQQLHAPQSPQTVPPPSPPSFQTPQERSISPNIFSPLRGNEAMAPAPPSNVPSTLSNLLDMLNPISRAEARNRAAARDAAQAKAQQQARIAARTAGYAPQQGMRGLAGYQVGARDNDLTKDERYNQPGQPQNNTDPQAVPAWQKAGLPGKTAGQAGVQPLFDTRNYNWHQMNAEFLGRLNQLYQALPPQHQANFRLESGWRPETRAEARELGMPTRASQESVKSRSLAGDPEARAAANPLGSNHAPGRAADIGMNTPQEVAARNAAAKIAGQFGLEFPFKGDAPHIQAVEQRESGRTAPLQNIAGYGQGPQVAAPTQVAGRAPAQAGRGPGGSQFANPGAPGRVTPHPGGPTFTFYGPGVIQDKAGRKGEGPYATANPDKEGKFVPHTLDDVRLGKSSYVTLAGSAANQGKSTNIGTVVYQSPIDNQWYTLNNVQAYVHDRGGKEFNSNSRLDVAVGDFTGKTNAQAAEFVSKNTMYPPGKGPSAVAAQPTAPPAVPPEVPVSPAQIGPFEGTQADYGRDYGVPPQAGVDLSDLSAVPSWVDALIEGRQADYGTNYGPGPDLVAPAPGWTGLSLQGVRSGEFPASPSLAPVGYPVAPVERGALPDIPEALQGYPVAAVERGALPDIPSALQGYPVASVERGTLPDIPETLQGYPVTAVERGTLPDVVAPPGWLANQQQTGVRGPQEFPAGPTFFGPEGVEADYGVNYGPGVHVAGPPLSLAPEFTGAPSWDEAGMTITGKGDLPATPFASRFGEWAAPEYAGPFAGPDVVGGRNAPITPTQREAPAPDIALTPPARGMTDKGLQAREAAGIITQAAKGLGKDAGLADFKAAIDKSATAMARAGIPADIARGAMLDAARSGLAARGLTMESYGGLVGSTINGTITTAMMGYHAAASGLVQGPWAPAQTQVAAQPPAPPSIPPEAPALPTAPESPPPSPTAPPSVTPPSVPAAPPDMASPSVPTTAVPDAREAARADPQTAQQIISNNPQAVTNIANSYGVDMATAAMMLVFLWMGAGEERKRQPWEMAEGGQVEETKYFFTPGDGKGGGKWPKARPATADYPRGEGYGNEIWRRAQENWKAQQVAAAAEKILSRVRVNPENWDRFIRESPRSTNIEDRREKDETMGAGYQQGGGILWGQDWGKEDNDGWR